MWRKIQYSLILLLFMCSFLSGCSKNVSESETASMENVSTKEKVFGASDWGETYCYTKTGFFCLRNNQMQYYDLEQKQSYVLCGQASCGHKDSTCPAWYTRVDDVKGLAGYKNYVYAFIWNEKMGAYEFVQMNMFGEERKTITTIPIGNYIENEWIAESIGNDIVYCGNMVWLDITKSFITEQNVDSSYQSVNQQLGIDLNTGEITYLNEIEELANGVSYIYEAISEDYIVMERNCLDMEKRLSKEAFISSYTEENFKHLESFSEFKDMDSLYEIYCLEWYPLYGEIQEELICYNIKTKEISILDSWKQEKIYDENEELLGKKVKYFPFGWYEKKLICAENETEESKSLFLWDMEKNEKQDLGVPKNADSLSVNRNSSLFENTFNNTEYLFCEYKNDTDAQIYSYHLDTGEVESLFLDIDNIAFRIEGETEKYFVGKMKKGTMWCYIKKEDYKQGLLKKAEKLW